MRRRLLWAGGFAVVATVLIVLSFAVAPDRAEGDDTTRAFLAFVGLLLPGVVAWVLALGMLASAAVRWRRLRPDGDEGLPSP